MRKLFIAQIIFLCLFVLFFFSAFADQNGLGLTNYGGDSDYGYGPNEAVFFIALGGAIFLVLSVICGLIILIFSREPIPWINNAKWLLSAGLILPIAFFWISAWVTGLLSGIHFYSSSDQLMLALIITIPIIVVGLMALWIAKARYFWNLIIKSIMGIVGLIISAALGFFMFLASIVLMDGIRS